MRKTLKGLNLFSSGRSQSRKSNVKRTSNIHEEKKMLPNESAKQIITASGGVINRHIKIL